MCRCLGIFPTFYILNTQFLLVEPKKPYTGRPKWHRLGGSPYRYFTDDPEGQGRGRGWYHKYHGKFFKKGGAAS